MLKLPTADDLGIAIPQSRRGVASVDPRVAGAPGQALASIGEVGMRIADNIAQKQDEADYAKAKAEFIKSKIAIKDDIEKSQDWQNYEQTYTQRISQAREAASSIIRNDRLKQRFSLETEVDAAQGLSTVRDLAQKKEADHEISVVNDLMTSNRSAALTAKSPSDRAGLIESTNTAIASLKDRGFIDEVQAGKLRRQWTEDYARGLVDMASPAEQIRMLKNPEKGSPVSFIQPDDRAKLIRQAQNELERQAAVYRARLSDTYQNDMAYLQAGGDPSKVSISRGELVNAFGAEKGNAYADEIDNAAEFSSTLRSLSNASPEDISAALGELKPTNPENFRSRSGRYNAYVTALNERQRLLASDPVSYLSRNIGDIGTAVEAAASGQGTWDSVVPLVDASYDKIGVGRGARHILPESAAKAYVADVMSEDGANISAKLDSLQASMSPTTWNRFYTDLVTLGELPASAQVVSEIAPNNAPAKQAIGTSLKLGKKIDDLVSSDDKKTINEGVDSALEDFRVSLQGTGATGQQAYLTRKKAVADLAKTYLANGTSSSASDAVSKAAADIVNWAYDYSSDGYRVPKAAGDVSRLDDVEEYASQMRLAITPKDLGILPADRELAKIIGEDEVRRQYSVQPMIWRNTANDEGLQLFYANSGIPVIDMNGKPVRFSFDKVKPGIAPPTMPPSSRAPMRR